MDRTRGRVSPAKRSTKLNTARLIRKRYIFGLVLMLLLVVAWQWAGPLYGFYAHKGDLPLPPTGWQTLPADAPQQQRLAPHVDADRASAALAAIAAHRARINAPALTAAIARNGRLDWVGATGWADIATRTPASPDTAFRIGSTSKIVTATVFARLTDAGTVTPDSTLPDVMAPLPNPQWANISLRQLSSHMAGLPHYKRNTDTAGLYHSVALQKHYATPRDALSVFDESELLHEPGTHFYYSSLGTVLLGAALGAAADTPYPTLVDNLVVAPLGLTSLEPAPRRGTADNGVATAYVVRGKRFRRWRDVDLSHRLPGGGFAATSADLARLGMAWLDEAYITPTTRDAFWTPQELDDGTVNEQNYALGFRVSERVVDGVGPVRHANHGGVSRGAQSWLMILPDHQMAIAININRKTDVFGDFAKLYIELARIFLGPT